ncbi:copper transport protein [Nocardioides luteus]|uniref:Copper resistance protein C n=1 Tax=Nocardioides luteus TaxID=1844 RepID=A0ABQ5SSQ9_9ACTN|nr:copper resistance protein CopC [Nocardioides luteus]MDR7311339.1 copper transport protein [Nocardioides luteus]GGR71104.1 copper resistance protein C [Nocardioides luteus]GLJ66844.1 copper resistance protein C [Nocardioides luteus]
MSVSLTRRPCLFGLDRLDLRWGGGPGRRALGRLLVVLAAAAYAVLLSVSPAQAHASLIGTNPEEGAVLDAAPETITFTFDEAVTLPPAGVTVYDAKGEEVTSEATASGTEMKVELAEASSLGDGTYVVAWRAVSADGHPISGSLTFAVGAPSLSVAPPPSAEPSKATAAIHGVLQFIQYAALLLVVGLVWFRALIVGEHRVPDRATTRVQKLQILAGMVAVLALVFLAPASGALQSESGPGAIFTYDAWSPASVGKEWLSALVGIIGIAAALALRERPRLAALAALVAIVSPALVGHSRAVVPAWLVTATDIIHLVAGALWLGGLVGLALTLPLITRRGTVAAEIVTRFSTLAAASLAALALSGVLMGWRILESWTNLLNSTYGTLLMTKVALVVAVSVMAAGNRLLVLPRVRQAAGHDDTVAAGSMLRRAVLMEIGVLVVVLGVTGFLVDRPPQAEVPSAGGGTAAVAQTGTQAAELGDDHRVYATLTPGTPGPNVLRLQIQDATGEPVEAAALPTAKLRSGDVDLGSLRLTSVGAGTWESDVVLPTGGTWEATVGLRLGEFESPLGVLKFSVR